MPVDLIYIAIVFFTVSGIPGLFFRPRSRAIAVINIILVAGGSLLGIFGAFLVFFTPASWLRPFPWPPFHNDLLGVDALSAFFLLPVFVIGGLGSVYSLGYWSPRALPRTAGRIRFFWGLILAGMTLLVIARGATIFLLGWETMALGAFFLIASEDGKGDTRESALIYLIATHVGTLTLFAFFSLWRFFTGSSDLVPAVAGLVPVAIANILFSFAFIGFGLKAGIMPLHFWLPGAHANAPSHVSALLSGVMLKMGIYGIIRVLTLLPNISSFWGWLLLLAGATSGLLGVIFALAQHDLKRLLAYHSVENIGIILLGLGLATLGRSYGHADWVILGMAGALLHVWNHSLFKALLFFGAGSVLHGARTRQIDRLGGLAKKMPLTAGAFMLGAAAISGIPPLNGFISEFFIYLGFFRSATSPETLDGLALLGAPALAMIGALAVSCFVKVYGAVFSGFPRTDTARNAHESPGSMLGPMGILSLLCLVIGLFPAITVPFLEKATAVWSAGSGLTSLTTRDGSVTVPVGAPLVALSTLVPFTVLAKIMIAALTSLVVAFAFFSLYRRFKAPKRTTWDCGYARPSPRMQYSAGSFARPLTRLFAKVLKPHERLPACTGSFPVSSLLESHVDDPVLEGLLLPEFRRLQKGSRWFYRFQQGRTQAYILYLVVTLVLLFATLIPFRALIFQFFTK